VERALRLVGRAYAPQVPIMALSVYERTSVYAQAHQQRSRAIWACGEARRAEEREYTYERRQEDLRQLRTADDGLRTPAKPRRRPYGG
jgi:hypothetical protein